MVRITKSKYFKWFIALFLFFAFRQNFPQINNIISGHYTIENGLSQSSTNCIAQDKYGFMWFGTQDGLNRFDGYGFTIFKNSFDDSTSLSDNSIICLLVDKSGTLWVGTDFGGLNKFNYESQSFTSFKHNRNNLNSISSNHINSIAEDLSGNIWIATNAGLDFLNTKNNSFIHYKHNSFNNNSLCSDSVNILFVDKNGNLWIGTDNGLDELDISKKKFSHFKNIPGNSASISSNKILAITQSFDGDIWIGTVDAGLNKLDLKNKIFISYKHSKDNASSLGSDSVEALLTDKDGTIWVGCTSGGINEFIPKLGKFFHFINNPYDPINIEDDQVLSIFQDREGLIWIGSFTDGVYNLNKNIGLFGKVNKQFNNPNGLNDDQVNAFSEDASGNILIGTDSGGLNILNKETGQFTHLMKSASENSLINNSIASLYVDTKGIIWIGTIAGLDKYDPINKTFKHYKHEKNNPNSLGNPYVNSIISDNSGNLWIGFWGGGFDKLDALGRFTHFKHDPKNPNSLCNDNISDLYLDKHGMIWIGTNEGLDCFNPITKNFTRFVHDSKNKNSLNENVIYSIYKFPNDNKPYLWIGTAGGGINRLNIKTGKFINFTEKDGLANNQVYGILGDKEGNLWLSTNKGISKFNPIAKHFKNYDRSFGLQSNEFNQGAFFQSKDGEMFFGGIKGFNMFYPENIKENFYKPPVVITSVKAFNKIVKLSNPIFLTKELSLSYKDYVLTFSFASLSYTNPNNNKFAYKLEGFDKEWIDLGKNNTVTFSNLNPGEYILHVKATNNDGIWNESGTSLKLIIKPPFWLTWWFKILFSLFLIFVLFILFRMRIKNIRNQNKMLEAIISERTKELQLKTKELEKYNKMQGEILEQLSESESELKELNAAKDKYFSILAHDLRSPFNSLVGFSDLLENEFENLDKDEIKKSARNINLSAKNLLKLINNLLEWSMFHAGKMEFKPGNENLSKAVDDVINIIHGNALQKSISIKNEIKEDTHVWADGFMLHSIFQNLISNSIKFTGRGGVVEISSNEEDGFVKIIVSDSGVGIDEEDIPKIFDIKKAHSTKGTENESGSGLGLNLCKELIKKHGGKISVESKKGTGTKFIFTLPKNN